MIYEIFWPSSGAFVIGTQKEEEDSFSPENDESVKKWAEREAYSLGLLK